MTRPTAAVAFSIAATCQHLALDPVADWRDTLDRLPTRLHELLLHAQAGCVTGGGTAVDLLDARLSSQRPRTAPTFSGAAVHFSFMATYPLLAPDRVANWRDALDGLPTERLADLLPHRCKAARLAEAPATGTDVALV
jgi:hypothetical protein